MPVGCEFLLTDFPKDPPSRTVLTIDKLINTNVNFLDVGLSGVMFWNKIGEIRFQLISDNVISLPQQKFIKCGLIFSSAVIFHYIVVVNFHEQVGDIGVVDSSSTLKSLFILFESGSTFKFETISPHLCRTADTFTEGNINNFIKFVFVSLNRHWKTIWLFSLFENFVAIWTNCLLCWKYFVTLYVIFQT